MSFNPKHKVAIDTETTGLNPWLGARPFSLAMCDDQNGDTLYWEWKVDPYTRKVTVPQNDVVEINRITNDPSLTIIFHNRPFDRRMMDAVGIKVTSPTGDSYIGSRVVNTLEPSYRLKDLAYHKCNLPNDDETELHDWVKKLRNRGKKRGFRLGSVYQEDFWIVQQIDLLFPELPQSERDHIRKLNEIYNCKDGIRTMALDMIYTPIIEADPAFQWAYQRESEVHSVVYDMISRGVRISVPKCQEEIRHNEIKARDTLALIRRECKDPNFNPNSPKQISNLLFSPRETGGLGLVSVGGKESGQHRTDWKALMGHANHPVVRAILQYKSSTKAIGTFFENYLELVAADELLGESHASFRDEMDDARWMPDGPLRVESIEKCFARYSHFCLHPTLNPFGALTGRFSCNDPNLQQVANSNTNARGTDPIQARAPFGPREGFVWYPIDYAQQELRIFADVAKVRSMLEAVHAGRDLNTENANRVWGGRGNPAAIVAAAQSLEFGQPEPSKQEVLEIWRDLGWDPSRGLGMHSTEAKRLAERWMSEFAYEIVAAEKSLGKTNTRGRSKIVTFAKIYGGGWKSVVELLYCSDQEAKDYMSALNRTYPEMGAFHQSVISYVNKNGYVMNAFGRKLMVGADVAYKGVNYIVQGTAADMVKEALIESHRYLRQVRYKGQWLDAHAVLPVHDELIFEIKRGHDYPFVLRTLKTIMEEAKGNLTVPMEAEMSRCVSRWDVKEKVHL